MFSSAAEMGQKSISNIPGFMCWYMGAAVNGESVGSIPAPGAKRSEFPMT